MKSNKQFNSVKSILIPVGIMLLGIIISLYMNNYKKETLISLQEEVSKLQDSFKIYEFEVDTFENFVYNHSLNIIYPKVDSISKLETYIKRLRNNINNNKLSLFQLKDSISLLKQYESRYLKSLNKRISDLIYQADTSEKQGPTLIDCKNTDSVLKLQLLKEQLLSNR